MQRNKAKQVIRQAKMEHESSILKSNPKRWHKINILGKSKKLNILLAH